MHLLEKEMVSLLTELKEKYNVSGVKMAPMVESAYALKKYLIIL